MQLDTQWTGLSPVKSSQNETTDDFWRRVYHKQARRTMVLYGTLRKYPGIRRRLTLRNAALDDQLPGYLSRCLLISTLYSEKLFPTEHPEKWNDELVEWLNHAYEVMLLRMRLEPGGSVCDIIQALLNYQLRENWSPALVSENGEILFGEASRLTLQSANGRPKAIIQQPTPFVYEQALKEGIKKVLWSSRVAFRMQQCVEQRGFYLGEKKAAIIDIIRAIHRCDNRTLDTAEKIRAFDFQSCVIDFLLTKRAWLTEQ